MSTQRETRPRAPGRPHGLAVAALALADGALVSAFLGGGLSIGAAVLLHGLAIAAAAGVLWRVGDLAGADAVLALTLAALSGPLGAAAYASLAGAGNRATGVDAGAELVRSLRRGGRIDPVQALADAIATGRMRPPGTAMPRSFPAVLDHGTLAEQQALLGIIGQVARPELEPVLAHALRNRRPAVRVQAAAILARHRDAEARAATAPGRGG